MYWLSNNATPPLRTKPPFTSDDSVQPRVGVDTTIPTPRCLVLVTLKGYRVLVHWKPLERKKFPVLSSLKDYSGLRKFRLGEVQVF